MLALHAIQKSFDDTAVLRSVSLSVAAGETVVLLGPSGCGKTTLLRIIAGLETADSGTIMLGDSELTAVPVHQRGFGMVFQDYALFPHKNVADNVAFGLRMAGWQPEQMGQRVAEMLAVVGLSGFDDRAVYELSGGEQQRVALARALAPAPRLLLLDEPLGALDRTLRERLMLELAEILRAAGEITAVYVTHDQAEAFAIADRVLVMNAGLVEQVGTPTTLYRQPRTAFVARFLGMENLLRGEWVKAGVVETRLGRLQLADGGGPLDIVPMGEAVTLLIRPEAGSLAATVNGPLHGRVHALSFRGRYQIATIDMDVGMQLKLEFDTAVALPAAGNEIVFYLAPEAMMVVEGSEAGEMGNGRGGT